MLAMALNGDWFKGSMMAGSIRITGFKKGHYPLADGILSVWRTVLVRPCTLSVDAALFTFSRHCFPQAMPCMEAALLFR